MSEIAMAHLVEAIDTLKARFSEHLNCVETGTIRSYTEKHNSTLRISEALGGRGSLVSVDINSKSIQISKDICKKCSNITWIHSDSLDYLSQKNNFHFAFLDSVNNQDHIFEEFKILLPQMIDGGIIVVDDAGVTLDGMELEAIQEKGRRVSTFLLSLGCKNFVRNSFHGTQLWIELPLVKAKL